MVTSHILEVTDCVSLSCRNTCKKDIESSGVTILDEKMNYGSKVVRFYLLVKSSDQNTERSFIEKLKKTSTWNKCGWLTRISRGTNTTVNLLSL